MTDEYPGNSLSYDPDDPLFSDCGSQLGHRIFGGYLVLSGGNTTNRGKKYRLYKNFSEVEPHSHLIISFKFFAVDAYYPEDENIQLFVNVTNLTDGGSVSDELWQWTKSPDLCGNPKNESDKRYGLEKISDVLVVLKHTGDSFTLKIYTDSQNYTNYWGIRELKIEAALCDKMCYGCDGPA